MFVGGSSVKHRDKKREVISNQLNSTVVFESPLFLVLPPIERNLPSALTKLSLVSNEYKDRLARKIVTDWC